MYHARIIAADCANTLSYLHYTKIPTAVVAILDLSCNYHTKSDTRPTNITDPRICQLEPKRMWSVTPTSGQSSRHVPSQPQQTYRTQQLVVQPAGDCHDGQFKKKGEPTYAQRCSNQHVSCTADVNKQSLSGGHWSGNFLGEA